MAKTLPLIKKYVQTVLSKNPNQNLHMYTQIKYSYII